MRTHVEQLRLIGNSHPVFNMAFDKGSIGVVMTRFGYVLSIAIEYLRGLAVKELTPEAVEEIIDGAETLYDIHVGPIDLPWIPNSIEPLIDAQIRAMIRPNIEAVAAWIRRPAETKVADVSVSS